MVEPSYGAQNGLGIKPCGRGFRAIDQPTKTEVVRLGDEKMKHVKYLLVGGLVVGLLIGLIAWALFTKAGLIALFVSALSITAYCVGVAALE